MPSGNETATKPVSQGDVDRLAEKRTSWFNEPASEGIDRRRHDYTMTTKRLIVGISGASGVIYGIRLLEVLREVPDLETHVVMSNAAKRTLPLETDYPAGTVEAFADRLYRVTDIAAALSSGSFKTMGMVVAPCSMKTVSGIANSYADNLLLRAADVVLKERRRLVLVVRETPLHLGHLRLLTQVTEMGAVVMPPVPAFYHRPNTIQAIVDQTVNRVLDLLDIELDHDLFERWQSPEEDRTPTADPSKS
jgi:4-hydroxy-3-polyprenylbenzoate decarboxylase